MLPQLHAMDYRHHDSIAKRISAALKRATKHGVKRKRKNKQAKAYLPWKPQLETIDEDSGPQEVKEPEGEPVGEPVLPRVEQPAGKQVGRTMKQPSRHSDEWRAEGCRILHKRDPSEGLCEKCERFKQWSEYLDRTHAELVRDLAEGRSETRKKEESYESRWGGLRSFNGLEHEYDIRVFF